MRLSCSTRPSLCTRVAMFLEKSHVRTCISCKDVYLSGHVQFLGCSTQHNLQAISYYSGEYCSIACVRCRTSLNFQLNLCFLLTASHFSAAGASLTPDPENWHLMSAEIFANCCHLCPNNWNYKLEVQICPGQSR